MSDNENVTVALDQNELMRTQQPSTSSAPIGMYFYFIVVSKILVLALIRYLHKMPFYKNFIVQEQQFMAI